MLVKGALGVTVYLVKYPVSIAMAATKIMLMRIGRCILEVLNVVLFVFILRRFKHDSHRLSHTHVQLIGP